MQPGAKQHSFVAIHTMVIVPLRLNGSCRKFLILIVKYTVGGLSIKSEMYANIFLLYHYIKFNVILSSKFKFKALSSFFKYVWIAATNSSKMC